MSGEVTWGTATKRVWRDFSIILRAFVVAALLTSTGVHAAEPVSSTPAAASALLATPPTTSGPEPPQTEGADAASLCRMAEGYEQLGKLARAWKVYMQAAERALLAGDTATRAHAMGKAEALSGGLARLTLQVSFFDRKPDTFWLDDEPLGPGDLGLALPIDPGRHRLVAHQPGYVRWHKTFAVSAGKSYSLTVPSLVLESAPSPLGAVPPQDPTAPSTASAPPVAPPVSPPLVLAPSREVATVLRLQRELRKLQKAREDVSLGFPILLMAAGTVATLTGTIDLVSRATGGSGVLDGGGQSQGVLFGVLAIAGGVGGGVLGGVLLDSRLEKRRVLDLLIDRRLERLSHLGVSARFGPASGTFVLYGAF